MSPSVAATVAVSSPVTVPSTTTVLAVTAAFFAVTRPVSETSAEPFSALTSASPFSAFTVPATVAAPPSPFAVTVTFPPVDLTVLPALTVTDGPSMATALSAVTSALTVTFPASMSTDLASMPSRAPKPEAPSGMSLGLGKSLLLTGWTALIVTSSPTASNAPTSRAVAPLATTKSSAVLAATLVAPETVVTPVPNSTVPPVVLTASSEPLTTRRFPPSLPETEPAFT